MKIVAILVFKIFLITLMLIKPLLLGDYFLKNTTLAVVLELTECEEDKSEESSFESADEIFHQHEIEWNNHLQTFALKKSSGSETDQEEHIREIVPPPPQA